MLITTYLGDTALHDEKVGVVDVELDGMEQILYARRLRYMAIDEILVPPANNKLAIQMSAVRGFSGNPNFSETAQVYQHYLLCSSNDNQIEGQAE